MVSVEEASRIVFSSLYEPKTEKVSLDVAMGKVLAEEIVADRAFPPFNRVAMDGIAISIDSWNKGSRRFEIEFTQGAGEPQRTLTNALNCAEVMTGSILPNGADTVIRYEDLSIVDGAAIIQVEALQPGQNIHRYGADAHAGEVLLQPGFRISAAEIALLASVGKADVMVYTRPAVAVISSGDELVAVDASPLPHQIRRSNVFALMAAAQSDGCSVSMYHLPDNADALRVNISNLLSRFDVLVLSGGVSKGKFDFIPKVLEECGVKKLFHEVSQRPGKPFWFGKTDNGKVVFALPGNPVSTFMCYYKYVRPWIIASIFGDPAQPSAILGKDFTFEPRLTYFLQVKVSNVEGKLVATPAAGGGSGDFANLKGVTGFLELPKDKSTFSAGELFPYIPFR